VDAGVADSEDVADDEPHARKVIHGFTNEGFDSLRPDSRVGRPRRITTTGRQRW
jgi:hypothetical protein